MIKLGVLPVRSLLLVEDALWAASGGQVFMVSMETHTIEVSAAPTAHSNQAFSSVSGRNGRGSG